MVVLTPMMVEVALIISMEEVAPALTMESNEPICPWNWRIRRVGELDADECSMVSLAPFKVVVPMDTVSPMAVRRIFAPSSVQPAACEAVAQTPLTPVQTREPCS